MAKKQDTITFEEATREKTWLKMALIGPPAGGKSYTALRLATLLKQAGLGKRIGVIETEAGKIKKYVGASPDGVPFQFGLAVLSSYSPLEYQAAMDKALAAGCDILIVDSLSHAWAGKDGILETVDATDGKSKFTSGWKVASPIQTRFVDTLLQCPAHVIATMRTKVEYILEDKEVNGRTVQAPKRIGTAPIQRDGIEYEFEIVGSFDVNHVMTVTKTICEDIDGGVYVKPGPDFAKPVIQWLQTGVVVDAPEISAATMATDEQVRMIMRLIPEARKKLAVEKESLLKLYGAREFHQLTVDQAGNYIQRLEVAKKKVEDAEAAKQKASPALQGSPLASGNGTATSPSPSSIPPGVDPAAGKTQAPDAAPPPKEPRDPKTLTDGSWRELLQLRGSWAAAKGIAQDDGAGIASAWKTLLLTKHGVETAKALDFDGYWRLRRELEADVEAFEKAELKKKNAQIQKEAGPNDAGKTFQDTLLDATGLDANTGRPVARASA